ncbi:hypothetical protein Hypma_000579 [Hypsizygus marmoreus]|uniref:Uncharacterized protein n=1 Tax=Hypsizygus marmoreus TaxID=39966 RepID=A0A369JES4_HYPMA|nr:hypothetical protein Hypma_000579 [Hypsizygus marmoreus]
MTSLMDKGIRHFVETGMAVCAIALLKLVLFVIFPNHDMHYFPEPSNSVMRLKIRVLSTYDQ